MPSVGMRRSTRVLVVKGGEGARVLRSGRRLWPDSDGQRFERTAAHGGGSWCSHDGDGAANCKANGWHRPGSKKQHEVVPMAVDTAELKPPKKPQKVKNGGKRRGMWGSVYYRKKRKRVDEGSSDSLKNDEKVSTLAVVDRMFGKHYVRRKRRKTSSVQQAVLAAALDASSYGTLPFVRFLGSVLGYMMQYRISVSELASFLISGAVHEAFSSHGIHFSQVAPRPGPGFCKFYGVVCFVPLFSVDFSAVSSCFLYMHVDMLIRSRCPLLTGLDKDTESESDTDAEEDSDGGKVPSKSLDIDLSERKTLISGVADVGKKPVLRAIKTAPRVVAQNAARRKGFSSLKFQTKRRSRRSTRARNSFLLPIRKGNGDLVPTFLKVRNDDIPLSLLASGRRLRSSVRKSTSPNIKEVKSALVEVREDVDSICCSASLLIFESDRCYREEGINVVLETCASKQWVLAVRKEGSLRYSHAAQNVMKPCASNRITHSIIWTAEDGWKLEFPNRGDWFIFKELYKECCDRNAQAPLPLTKIIPVPGVQDISDYEDSRSNFFSRPDSYIIFNDDELSRAMAKRTANYDIDSEDEDWLNKFNEEMIVDSEQEQLVSAETFELMVDAFEKAQFCSPDDYSDEAAAIDLCLDLGTRVVVEAVYRYWMRKRKQKRSALVRIFESHQPKKPQLIPKNVLRKRRSFKRQASQAGRGKQRALLQAFAAEQTASAELDALEELNAMMRVEEAKNSATRSMEQAIDKRKRAQLLMEKANLAVYKATMALKIAEAAQVAESTDAAAAAFFIDEEV